MEAFQEYYSTPGKYLHYWGSDVHYGGCDFDRHSFSDIMGEACERKAKIRLIGDIIGGITHMDKRYTVRTSKDSIRGKDAFVNQLVDELCILFEPYAEYLSALGIGNHEYEFIKHYGADPIRMAIKMINMAKGTEIKYLGIRGFLWFTFRPIDSGPWHSYKTFYFHGSGGSAPVTEGVISAKRIVEGVDDVDCLVLGHTHKNWSIRNRRWKLNKQCRVEEREVRLINTGSHQKSSTEQGDHNLQWSDLKGFRPSPMSGAFLHLKVDRSGVQARVEH